MARVYRVENSWGEGPYSTGSELLSWMRRKHSADLSNHPTPWRDGIKESALSARVCGFSSLKKLMRWFDIDDRRAMKAAGFQISVYEANDIISGHCQIVFARSGLKPVNRLRLGVCA